MASACESPEILDMALLLIKPVCRVSLSTSTIPPPASDQCPSVSRIALLRLHAFQPTNTNYLVATAKEASVGLLSNSFPTSQSFARTHRVVSLSAHGSNKQACISPPRNM